MDINIQAHQKVFTAHVMILEERNNNKIKKKALRAVTLRNRCMMALENEWQTELQALNFFPDLEEKRLLLLLLFFILNGIFNHRFNLTNK